jgi:hypothetical protein
MEEAPFGKQEKSLLKNPNILKLHLLNEIGHLDPSSLHEKTKWES